MMRSTVASLIFVMWVSTLNAQVSASSIDSLFAKYRPQHPGCAVLVVKDGIPIFEKGYGVADLRTHEKITPETNFRLASLTKQFTAMAIMLLVHDGKLRYDERLTDIFPGFPAYGQAITIRQMLNHTSGLIDYEDIMGKDYSGVPDGKITQIHDAGVLDLLERESSTRFVPGTHWEYSNSGYVLLGLVVQQRSGMKFGDFLRQRIFLPSGMTHTIVYEKGKNEVEHRAYGHTLQPDGFRETDQSSTSATLGDGGIYSSLQDLAKWDGALRKHTLLSKKEMEAAFTAATAPNGGPLTRLDGSMAPLYGFGWFLDAYHGHRRYWHYGETVAFRTAIERFPDQRLTVVVLSNRLDTNAPALADRAADLYLGKQ
jgi:CubicO group peptidase (beta-lactamase class C family)